MKRAIRRLGLTVTAGLRADEPITLALAVTFALTIYFLAFPSVDMMLSSLFYREGAGFFLSQDPFLKGLRESSTYVLGLLLLGLIGRLAWESVRRGGPVFAPARRTWFLLAGLAVGPGLLVNTLLKDYWGRPRPVALEAFGGEAPYVPVWQITDWCQDNCSFVSGESSSSAWMLAALVLVPAAWRPIVAGPLILYGVSLSLNRLAFGGHFISDILLSWSLTGLALAVLYRIIVAAPGVAARHRVRRRISGQPVPAPVRVTARRAS